VSNFFITVNGGTFLASYLKHGTGTVHLFKGWKNVGSSRYGRINGE
jgi:hypothetical protein